MSGHAEARIIDDFPNDLVPIPVPRECDKCGSWTFYASPRQKVKGRHWHCVPGIVRWRCTPEQELRVLTLALTTFPDAELSRLVRPRYRPDTYDGRDAGPCVGCHRRIRRYGQLAHPFCLDCQPEENS